MNLIYNLGIFFYSIAITLASPFNKKAKLWLNGRRNIFNKLPENADNDNIIWFHASSLGEFEQGRPLIEKIKKENTNIKILLTFFSPSGYEIRKDYDLADYVFYLPSDSKKNAKRFIQQIKPSKAIFIKYEFWVNYISQLNKNNIPTYFISVNFREGQRFFTNEWWAKQLHKINHIFVQTDKSAKLLESINYNNYSITGDTRFDRVWEASKNKKEYKKVERFIDNKNIILAGSTWPQDEKHFSTLYKELENTKLIIAPHQIDKNHINQIISLFDLEEVLLYSNIENYNSKKHSILIIDCIGILLHLYQYCDIAYIGGGFSKSIHNTLEAATFGKPVVFGPASINKFQEALDLINYKGALLVKDYNEFANAHHKLLNDKAFRKTTGINSYTYVINNIGSTDKIFSMLNL